MVTRSPKRGEGLVFQERTYWSIKPKAVGCLGVLFISSVSSGDFSAFVRGLLKLFPRGAMICLHDPAGPSDVIKRIEAISVPSPTLIGLMGKGHTFHVPLEPQSIEQLVDLAKTHAVPEICTHLHVYRDNRLLLEGYDILDSEVRVSGSVDEDVIRAVCESIKCPYKKVVESEE